MKSMKSLLKLMTLILLIGVIFSACEKEEKPNINENAYVAFVGESASISEGSILTIPVTMVAKATKDIEVLYKLEETNCKEGIDFSVVNSGTLVFPDGMGVQNIELSCITNDIVEEDDRTVKLTLTSNTADFNIGLENTSTTFTVTLVNDDEVSVNENAYVAFVEEAGSIEEGNDLQIPVVMLAIAAEDVTLTYKIETVNCDAGTDFSVLNSGYLVFPNGTGIQNIDLTCIDNDIFDAEERTVKLTLISNTAGYNIGLNDTLKTYTVTLVNDDEKPFEVSDLYGTYQVTGTSYFDSKGIKDLTVKTNKSSAITPYTIVITQHNENNKVYIAQYLDCVNLTGADPYRIEATVDVENKNFTILRNHVIFKTDFSDPEIGDNAMVVTGYFDGVAVSFDDVVGSISEDNTISFSGLAALILTADESYAGVYDIFTDCTFTKIE
ncbi:MAG: hypothetical protein GQ564_19500 [Bacteroidales bacterium]|nr:hypothetical protein [Bacteroidales bacterium]